MIYWRKWAKGIAACSVLCLALYFLFALFVSELRSHDAFFFLTLFVFIAFTILLFLLGFRTIRSTQSSAFNAVIILSVLLKLLLGLLLIVGYTRLKEPGDIRFVIPFFIVYIVFTVYETVVMSNLAREST